MNTQTKFRLVLPVIVIAQFCCTSLWFAGNGVMKQLTGAFGLAEGAVGDLTSAVQFGFLAGTLTFAVLAVADRFSPSRVFLASALAGALFNAAVVWSGNTPATLLLWRALTGFCLAGIYPVGMKIAADHFAEGLGKSLGYLVGALVVGTALPHLLSGLFASVPWRVVVLSTSALAVAGGLLLAALVPDGPYRKAGSGVKLTAFFRVFRDRDFRGAALGYFGHMWELYAFWTFVPAMLLALPAAGQLNGSLWSFGVIAAGGVACVLGGYLSEVVGVKRTAQGALLLSGVCCVLSPWLLTFSLTPVALVFLVFWGMVVVMDSPMFSTLVARSAPAAVKGTALTIVNCVGYAITIVSIQLVGALQGAVGSQYVFLVLAAGPALGLLAIWKERYNP